MHARLGSVVVGWLAVVLAVYVGGSGQPARAEQPRPNVLLVICDDLCCALGCYGDATALTPNIDKLAGRGVRFTRAYCQYPLCNPSRASLLTGRRPARTGVRDNTVRFRDVDPGVVTLPQAFRDAGYRVERIGKLYHYGVPGQIGTDGLDDPPSWEAVFNPKGRDKADEAKVFSLEPGMFGGTVSWLAAEGSDAEQTDGLAAARAVARLEAFSHDKTPFFLAVGFFRPHTPYVAPKPWFDRHPLAGVRLPDVPVDHDARVPKAALASRKPEQVRLHGDLGREALQAYRAAVSFVDAQVGEVVGALDRFGLADDTIIVFTSDHGYHLGEHDLWQKQSLFEESARVPLVIALPPRLGGVVGATAELPVELIDVYPTVCELAGVTLAPAAGDGRSLATLVAPRGKAAALADRPAFTEVERGGVRGVSLRTARYRYTEWNGGAAGRQLYDHDTDPGERVNLADEPGHAETVATLARLLRTTYGADLVAPPSVKKPPPAASSKPSPPNVVVILADDLGFSDVGAYGGEIDTPHLDRLARGGLRFTQATNTARCWPSRAALLTGFHPQAIGRDALPELEGREALPGGAQGKRPPWARLLPEFLKAAGYRGYHSGKWHIDGAPLAQGFDRSLDVTGTGQSNFFDSSGVTVEGEPHPKRADYYATTAIGDHAVACLEAHARDHDGRPFFQYVAFTAPHFPLQAPQALIDKYRDRYRVGWEAIRAARHARQRAAGIVAGAISPVERDLGPPYAFPEALQALGAGEVDRPLEWERLTPEQREFQATKMAIHAAMVEAMDEQVGRIVATLQARGLLDDTLILFASDNGASAEIMVRGEGHDPAAPPGSRKSFLCLGPGWSSAANTPFRRHKTWVHEGGIATPWIVHWPRGLPEGSAGGLRHQPVHLVDVTPTILKLAGVEPETHRLDGTPAPPMQGRSFSGLLADATAPPLRETSWWCHEGHRAVRVGEKKLVAAKGEPWALHDLASDRAETVDLAAAEPETVARLEREWLRIAEECRTLAAGGAVAPAAAAPSRRPPNVVIVFADDLGYADPACYGGRAAATPHLDRLAREGIRFTDFHVAQPVCSASRAALLTGCYPNRIGIAGALGPSARHGIAAAETTLAEALRGRGYRTGLVGKWHLGHRAPFLPTRHGFDEWFGLPYSNDMWPHHPEAAPGSFPPLPLFDGERIVDDDVTPAEQVTLTARYAERAVAFVDRAKEDDRPFFLYLAHSMPHVPLYAGAAFAGTTPGGLYGDVLAEIDASVGSILAALERTGTLDDTLVLFTSDNGPWLSYGNHAGSAGPLREGKGTVFEGGVRVPCLARLPGVIPAGSVCAAPAMTIDLLPTVLRLTGEPVPVDADGRATLDGRRIDGHDITGLLRGEPAASAAAVDRTYGFWYLDNELQAVRRGRFKLLLPHTARTLAGVAPGADGMPAKYRPLPVARMLFDLEADPGETLDVAADHPDVVAGLEAEALRLRGELGDRLTGINGRDVRPAGSLDDAPPAAARHRPPNIVVVMTDDQGYGDLAAHGNPVLETPHLDRLWRESVRFTEYHVSPTCSPTRTALLTGRHEFRSGVTHTIDERERLALSATTLPQVLRASGYTTGIFGKWHLGDEADHQPGKRGFDRSVIHGAGGIGQAFAGSCGDVPGNRYVDPVLREDGRFVKRRGYCTDLFFAAGIEWIEEATRTDKPFFCLITPNAPHDPLDCPEGSDAGPRARLAAAGLLDEAGRDRVAKFYGMIENIDTNVGRLLDRLTSLGIAEETLVVFTTDNGTATGAGVFNDAMRGTKGSVWRGGTRVPSLWRWPGALPAGVDVPALVAHVDILPTLCEIARAPITADVAVRLEGRSLVPLLLDAQAPWPDRPLVTHLGRWARGEAAASKWRHCRIREGRYSLVNVDSRPDAWQLFDVLADPAEQHDLAATHGAIVERLAAEYDRWWDSIQPGLVNEDLDGPAENPFKTAFEAQFGVGATAATVARPPNIVFFLADDLGTGDVAALGSAHALTPNIDSLFARGTRLTRHWAGSAVCAPSRCVLMTGLHPGHAPIRSNSEVQPEGQRPMPAGTLTLPGILHAAGYATGGFGKWGLGPPGSPSAPVAAGFDRFFGYNCQRHAHSFYPTYLWDDSEKVSLDNPPVPVTATLPADPAPTAADFARFRGTTYSADRIGDEAVRFLRSHAAEPFFLYLPTTLPHVALQVPADEPSLEHHRRFFGAETPYLGGKGYVPCAEPAATLAAMVTRMDREVGRIVATLDELGLTDDTIFVFTSDNGATFPGAGGVVTDRMKSNGALRDWKGSPYEGGLRVPAVVVWPGRIAAGASIDTPTGCEDWLPTLLDLAVPDAPRPGSLDGRSLAAALLGRQPAPASRTLYRELTERLWQTALEVSPDGCWKVVRRGLGKGIPDRAAPVELYELGSDPAEAHDLAAARPEVARRLERLLDQEHRPDPAWPLPFADAATARARDAAAGEGTEAPKP